MEFEAALRQALEEEERATVGQAFGGSQRKARKQFSVANVRKFVVGVAPYGDSSDALRCLKRAHGILDGRPFKHLVNNLLRFSFLIELTKLDLGSTQMKTRWLPGLINMSREGTFEVVEGEFKPGSDPRAATFDECLRIFVKACSMACEALAKEAHPGDLLLDLDQYHSVPYEFPFTYADPRLKPVHRASNIVWARMDDVRWLIKARKILSESGGDTALVFRQISAKKFEVKVYKTDRSLTGKDKSNRAKRWEILVDDFQHASLEDCWSAERKLINDFVCFGDFPSAVREIFTQQHLIAANSKATSCPVTLEPLSFARLSEAILQPTHGVSEYQIGHLKPLKRAGKHSGDNVCWQSADGNRIQGDLTVEETHRLLTGIEARREARS